MEGDINTSRSDKAIRSATSGKVSSLGIRLVINRKNSGKQSSGGHA